MKKIIALVVLITLLCAVGVWQWQVYASPQPTFRFDEVKRGRLIATISATGTLQPREVVDIGAQVAGPIIAIGKDSNTQSGIVDWGSEVQGPTLDKEGKKIVKKGTVLAQIDPDLYEAQVESATAALNAARADSKQKTAVLGQATADWERAQKLYAKLGATPQGISQAEFDQFKATHEVAEANLATSLANIGVAEANLRNAKKNLDYTTITSPVDGIVIDRRVNVGQTVVASLSAPSLFLIAKDLKKMEVWATVNEVDVGKIKVGQDVRFTVDAYQGKKYKGKVIAQGRQAKRLNATMNQNVVTYTVVVSVDNSDLSLDPYLTANLSFIIEDKKDALLVPNAALRWQPSKKQIAPEVVDAYNALHTKKRGQADADAQDRGFVWVPTADGHVRYIEVRTGASDTVNTEVLGVIGEGELPEHTQIIVGESKSDSRAGGSSNPFSPQMFKGKPKE
jgi:HlyD family secretion protein